MSLEEIYRPCPLIVSHVLSVSNVKFCTCRPPADITCILSIRTQTFAYLVFKLSITAFQTGMYVN
jgi:hypothetical protein